MGSHTNLAGELVKTIVTRPLASDTADLGANATIPSSPCLNRSFSADSFGQYTSGEIPPAVRDGGPDPATSLGIRSCSRDKSQ